MSNLSLRITEIFHSLQGEARFVGYPTVFVRLTGCPLRCDYCDSAYAFEGGERMSFDAIRNEVAKHGARHVCVTGGEPLAQPACLGLLSALCDDGYGVSLETSGAMDIAEVDDRVSVVMDLKTPDSGELDRNMWANIPILKPKDQLKFVICSQSDFEWARFKVSELNLEDKVGDIYMSPSFGAVSPEHLAGWVLDSKLNVRMQLQLHKLLWGDKPGV